MSLVSLLRSSLVISPYILPYDITNVDRSLYLLYGIFLFCFIIILFCGVRICLCLGHCVALPLWIDSIDWHKAGKGPDPKLAKLDADMDDYFAKKEDDGAEVVTTETVAETVTEAVVEVPETETTTE